MVFKGKSFVLKVAKQHSLTQARLFYNSFSTKLLNLVIMVQF